MIRYFQFALIMLFISKSVIGFSQHCSDKVMEPADFKFITQTAKFEIRFNEVHVEFYNSLNKKYPGLSPNELRLSAFLRLNMSSKKISTITFQSFQSIKIARYRLRKKLGLEKGANLVSYLNQF